jgi:[CysO sulfur-carrier protein]-S-L-cysteine hydrolase
MRISRELYDRMVAHARADAPDECCGIISSRDGEAVALYEIENTAHSPLKYVMDSEDQRRVMMAIDDDDLDVGVIYHSHTRSKPYPSQTDINLAFYPDSLYVIIGLASGPEADVRAFTIQDGAVQEAHLSIV